MPIKRAEPTSVSISLSPTLERVPDGQPGGGGDNIRERQSVLAGGDRVTETVVCAANRESDLQSAHPCSCVRFAQDSRDDTIKAQAGDDEVGCGL